MSAITRTNKKVSFGNYSHGHGKIWSVSGMFKVQNEHKRTLHFQNDTEDKYDVRRTPT